MRILKSNNLRKTSGFFSIPLCFLSSSSLSTTTNQTNFLNSKLTVFLSKPISTFKSLLQFHAFLITTGHSNNIFVAAKLISSYSSFNKPDFSTHIFNAVNPKDTFLWNSIIKCHFSIAQYSRGFQMYLQMRISKNILPNAFTIPMVVASCAELLSLPDGKSVHVVVFKLGLFADNSAVGSSFVYLYSKCGEMRDACKVFDEMPVRDVVAWTTLVVGYVRNCENEKGFECFREMHKCGNIGEKPNFRTIEGGLQACGNMRELLKGRCLHGYVVKTGNGCSQFVQSSLLSMYSKCESTQETHLAFLEMPNKDLVSWTTLIGAYARSNSVHGCVKFFWEMLFWEIEPDGITISCLLSCFGNSGWVKEGKAFHGLIIRRNFEYDYTVGTALLSMYCKFGCLALGEKLFYRMCKCDIESWEIMISWYAKLELGVKCIEMLRDMQHLGVKPTTCSLLAAISSCSQLMALGLGRSAHCFVIKSSMDENISITNSLVAMYAMYGNLSIATKIFQRAHKDIVTWNTLISAYTTNGCSNEALALFDQMVLSDLQPNKVTLLTVLDACSHVGDLNHGKKVHAYIKKIELGCDLSLVTALVNMYLKCGQLEISREIFESVTEKDVILCNVMISGYGIHGDAESALEVFLQMEKLGVRPTKVSFLAILSACTHAGLVEEGKYIFDRMRHYSVTPSLKHYTCMVDLLGRAGNLQEAESMILSMPIAPDGGVWGALLGACKIHNNVLMGEHVAKQAIQSDPENDGYYVFLSNMYSSRGKWEEANKVREMMKNKGVRKRAGWSAI